MSGCGSAGHAPDPNGEHGSHFARPSSSPQAENEQLEEMLKREEARAAREAAAAERLAAELGELQVCMAGVGAWGWGRGAGLHGRFWRGVAGCVWRAGQVCVEGLQSGACFIWQSVGASAAAKRAPFSMIVLPQAMRLFRSNTATPLPPPPSPLPPSQDSRAAAEASLQSQLAAQLVSGRDLGARLEASQRQVCVCGRGRGGRRKQGVGGKPRFGMAAFAGLESVEGGTDAVPFADLFTIRYVFCETVILSSRPCNS